MATITKAKAPSSGKALKYSTLHELLILKLRVLHDVENQLKKALPKMEKAASDPKLKEAFASHLKETEAQEARIDEALELSGDMSRKKEKSEAIRGLIADAEWCITNIKDTRARDASLIAAAQYVEHYEMAGYGSACEWARLMGHDDIVDLLEESLKEEEAADKKLSLLAEGGINENVDTGHEDR